MRYFTTLDTIWDSVEKKVEEKEREEMVEKEMEKKKMEKVDRRRNFLVLSDEILSRLMNFKAKKENTAEKNRKRSRSYVTFRGECS